MTLQEALDLCGRMKPSQYTGADMRRWLSELDGRIYAEIIDARAGGDGAPFAGYGGDTPGDTPLLAAPPYDGLYEHYLGAQIDMRNAEYARYNNTMALFNAQYAAFADAYVRAHPPRRDTRVRV